MNERDGFDQRLREATDPQGLDPPSEGGKAGFRRPVGIGFRAGVELVSALVAGVGSGCLLDRWLGT